MTAQDLIAFLTERYNEEEAALKLVHRPYRLYIYDDGVMAEPEEYDVFDERQGEYKQDADGNDILRNRHNSYALLFDPDKALREIQVKRKLLGRFRRAALLNSKSHDEVSEKWYSVMAPNMVDLAAVYSDHPDHRSKWFED
jgi:hypothetical protein